MSGFEVETSTEGDRAIVMLAGECDLTTRVGLSSVLLDAVARASDVVVDLAAVTFLDSSGIHELVAAHHAARERGGRLYVRNAVGVAATVLELTGVGRLLSRPAVGDDSEAAVTDD